MTSTTVSADLAADDPVADARQLFEALRAASRRNPAPSAASRRASLAALRRLLHENEKALVAAISEDFGMRSRTETRFLEAAPLTDAIRQCTKHLEGWMKPEPRHTGFLFRPAKSWVRYEPLGVVGIISPWNYPLRLSLRPLIDVLAAGNRALLKPSELTPAFSALLTTLIAAYFPADELAVATGGADVAETVAGLPFDHLVFTGSAATGRKVMREAAANLTPVTLELGGKSPALVCAGYPIEKAARFVALGKFVNAGQTCIAPDYALVPAADVPAFAEAVMAWIRKAYPTIDGNPDYTSIISDRHRTRLSEMINEAADAGATIMTHGDEPDTSQRKIRPTIVLGASAESRLMKEEIFGPVLPIVPYDDLDLALASIRGGDTPLALYCFCTDAAQRERVLDGAPSGGVTVNGTLLHIAQDDLPFGGVGASGTGAYQSRDGFRRFSHARSVHEVGSFSAFVKLGPPWGRMVDLVIAVMKRR
jgi:coniferyl-aldehyde dehydrogenase